MSERPEHRVSRGLAREGSANYPVDLGLELFGILIPVAVDLSAPTGHHQAVRLAQGYHGLVRRAEPIRKVGLDE
jgi:hypothetical protein